MSDPPIRPDILKVPRQHRMEFIKLLFAGTPCLIELSPGKDARAEVVMFDASRLALDRYRGLILFGAPTDSGAYVVMTDGTRERVGRWFRERGVPVVSLFPMDSPPTQPINKPLCERY